MPAKRRNDPKYKAYVGRVFTLRNRKVIPAKVTRTSRQTTVPRTEFGDAVLVIDEDNSRVRVCMTNGQFSWIAKFYLHHEIESGTFETADTIVGSVDSLLKLAMALRSTQQKEQTGTKLLEVLPETLENIAASLRQIADNINPNNYNNNKKEQ